MTDTSSQTEPSQTEPAQPEQAAEKTIPQSELNRIVEERLARERQKYADYDDLKAAASRLKEIEDAGKSEQQKLNDQLADLQKQLAQRDKDVSELAAAKLRAEVAATKKVPPHRLQGTTKEELEADAERYLSELAESAGAVRQIRKPAPTGLKSGASSSGDTSANPKEAAAIALRRMFNPGS